MEFWKKNKWKIIAPVLIVLVLAAAFVFGDRNMPKQKDTSEQPTIAAPVETPEQDASTADTPDDVETKPVETPAESTPEPSDDPQTDESAQTDTEQPEYVSPEEVQASASGEYEEVNGMMIDTGTGKDKYQTDPVPEGKPIPVEPEDVEIGDAEYTCTLSISCATILDRVQEKKVVEEQNEKKQSVNSLPLRQYSCRLRRGYTDHPEKRPIRRRGILPSKHRNNLRRLWAQNRCPS